MGREHTFIVRRAQPIPPAVDSVPVITSTPTPVFVNGTASTYDTKQDYFDEGRSAVLHTLTGEFSAGVSFDPLSGILSYDGVGAVSISVNHYLSVIDATGRDVSSAFSIQVQQPPATVTIDPIPDFALNVGQGTYLGAYINDPNNLRTSTDVTGLVGFATYNPASEVLTGAIPGTETNLQLVVEVLEAPQIVSTPTPSFTEGTAATYDFSQDVNPEAIPAAFFLSGTLGAGLTLDTNTGILSYDGAGAASDIAHVLTVVNAAGTAVSDSFPITVVAGASTSDTPDYPDPLIGVTLQGGRTTIAATPGTLQNALNNAVAGQTIELAAGNYTTTYAINKTAPANNPIIIKGAANFTSIASNSWTIGDDTNNIAENVIVTGILFSGALVRVNFHGDHNRLIGNKFTGWGDLDTGSRYAISARLSQFNEIAYNEFYEHGPFVRDSYLNHPIYGGDGSAGTSLRIAIRTGESSTGEFMPTDTWVHHNLFRDFPDKPNPPNYSSGQNDALEWGETVRPFTPAFSTRLYFEFNMILRCLSGQGGPGVGFVDLKTGGGSVCRYNTWKESYNKLAQRGPTLLGITFESNYFDGTNSTAMSIHGCGNRIIGNVCNGSRIDLVSGQGPCGELPPASRNDHATCNAAVVAGNEASVRVGPHYGPSPYVPATNTLIEQHTGTVTLQDETGTINNSGQPTSINFAPAVALTESQVGPAGLALAPASYKVVRGL